MKVSEYKLLAGRLRDLTRYAGILRAVFAKTTVEATQEYINDLDLEPGEPIPTTMEMPTVEAREHRLFKHRYSYLDAAQKIAGETWDMMRSCEDSFYDENQVRADNGQGPTMVFEDLYNAMAQFLAAAYPEMKKEGIAGVFSGVPNRCRAWTDQANEWFPNLANIDVKRPAIHSTIDREKLSDCFKATFKRTNQDNQGNAFDFFFDDLTHRVGVYSPTDYGRVAYQIWTSSVVLPRIQRMKFAQWISEFFMICGIKDHIPKDKSPRGYKSVTTTTDFSDRLFAAIKEQ